MIKLLLKFLIEYYEHVTGVPVLSDSTETLLMEKENQCDSEENNILKFLKSKKFLTTAAVLAATGGLYLYDPSGVIVIKFLTESFVSLADLLKANSNENIKAQAELTSEIIKNQEEVSLKLLEELKTFLADSDNSLQIARIASNVVRILAQVTKDNANPFFALRLPGSNFPGVGVPLSQDPTDEDTEIDD